MTSLPAWPQYKGRRENTSSSSFVFTDCFVWRVQSGKSTVLSLLSWRALARRLRSVWIRVLVIWHPMTHTIFAFFVWARSTHAMSFRGKSVCTVSFFLWKSSALVCPSFRGKRGSHLLPAIRDSPLPRHGGEWNSQLDLANELERGRPFSRTSAENESELLDCDDAIFLTSSDSAASALLGYAQEEQEMFEGEEV